MKAQWFQTTTDHSFIFQAGSLGLQTRRSNKICISPHVSVSLSSFGSLGTGRRLQDRGEGDNVQKPHYGAVRK